MLKTHALNWTAALTPTAWHLADSAKAVGAQADHQARPNIYHPIELQRPVQQRIDCVERDYAKHHKPAQAGCRKAGICDDSVRCSHAHSKMRAHHQGDQSGAAQNRDHTERSLHVPPHFINAILAQNTSSFVSHIFFKSGQAQRCKQHKQYSENRPPQRLAVHLVQTSTGDKCLSAQSSDQQICGGGKKAKKALVSQHICPSHQSLSRITSSLSDHASLIKRLKRRIVRLADHPVRPIMIWQAALERVADLRSIQATPMHKYISIQGVLVS